MKFLKVISFIILVANIFAACVHALEGDTAMTILTCYVAYIIMHALEKEECDV